MSTHVWFSISCNTTWTWWGLLVTPALGVGCGKEAEKMEVHWTVSLHNWWASRFSGIPALKKNRSGEQVKKDILHRHTHTWTCICMHSHIYKCMQHTASQTYIKERYVSWFLCFPIAVAKWSGKSNLKEKGFILAYKGKYRGKLRQKVLEETGQMHPCPRSREQWIHAAPLQLLFSSHIAPDSLPRKWSHLQLR